MHEGSLVGTWTLESFVIVDHARRVVSHPLGDHPYGFVVYTADHQMSVHIQRQDGGASVVEPARPHHEGPNSRDVETVVTTHDYIGYGGPYELVDGNVLNHHVSVASVAEWVGSVQVRRAELDGDVLTMHVVETTERADVRVPRVTWRRAAVSPFAAAAARRQYWRNLPAMPGSALWEGLSSTSVANHMPLLERYFDPTLPLVDVGCGSGAQTIYLASRFARVLGLDAAEADAARAHTTGPDGAVEFRQFDLLNPDTVAALSAELGDVNVYTRGLLHQLPADARPAALDALALLAGDRGHVFVIEPSPAAGTVSRAPLNSAEDPARRHRPDPERGIAPVGLAAGELDQLFAEARFRVVDTGFRRLLGADRVPDGGPSHIPVQYVMCTTTNEQGSTPAQ